LKRQFICLLHFGFQNGLACLFPALVFSLLALSHLCAGWIPRYDFLLVACIAVQIVLYKTGIETKDEVAVICIFHALGLAMEIFKVHIGSWSYPEFAYTKFFGVPLYSGFMYSSVSSYMCQAWRRLNLKMTDWPAHSPVRIAGALIYINFFSNHFIYDVRYLIGLFVLILFWKSKVHFTVRKQEFKMPVSLSFALIGFFIWLAENMATFLGAWKYAYQHNQWSMVNYQKISSWAFLVIVSYIIVAELKMLKEKGIESINPDIKKPDDLLSTPPASRQITHS